MKVFSLIFLFLSFSLFAQNAPKDVACKDLPAYVKASIDNETQTLSNIVKYFNDNAQNWFAIDNIVRQAFEDRNFRRNNSYSGAAYNEGSKSSSNANVMGNHRAQLVKFNIELAARLNECLNPPVVAIPEEVKVE